MKRLMKDIGLAGVRPAKTNPKMPWPHDKVIGLTTTACSDLLVTFRTSTERPPLSGPV